MHLCVTSCVASSLPFKASVSDVLQHTTLAFALFLVNMIVPAVGIHSII
jgi:hypothetical protein